MKRIFTIQVAVTAVLFLLFMMIAKEQAVVLGQAINKTDTSSLQSQLDITWSVMPEEVVGKNFGRRIKNNYYCIAVAVGNTSVKDFKIIQLGFKLRREGSIDSIVPASGYRSLLHGLTAPQVIRLCDQAFRDGLVVPSQVQIRTIAFLPKELFGKTERKGMNNPQDIQKSLGHIVLIGGQIETLNRIVITDQPER